MAKAIPEGFHTLTPHLVVDDAKAALAFYKQAFGAVELMCVPEPKGKRVMHAEMKIGDSVVMLVDTFSEMGAKNPKDLQGSPVMLHIYTADADAMIKRAEKAGATVTMPVEEMFWGDRYGSVRDPFGHSWSVATHVRDVSPDQMKKAAEQAFAKAQ